MSGVSSASAATAFNKATFTGNSVNDVTQYSAFVQGTYQVAPSVKTNVGVGYVVETAKAFVKDDNRIAAFVNAPITLAKNVTIVPEIAYIDLLDQTDGSKGFKDVVYGAKWQFDF